MTSEREKILEATVAKRWPNPITYGWVQFCFVFRGFENVKFERVWMVFSSLFSGFFVGALWVNFLVDGVSDWQTRSAWMRNGGGGCPLGDTDRWSVTCVFFCFSCCWQAVGHLVFICIGYAGRWSATWYFFMCSWNVCNVCSLWLGDCQPMLFGGLFGRRFCMQLLCRCGNIHWWISIYHCMIWDSW